MSLARACLTLILAVLVLSTPADAKLDPLKSIQPLEQFITDDDTGTSSWVVSCTAFATQMADGRHVWATAGHCVSDVHASYRIRGERVDVLKVLYNGHALDMAVFVGGPAAAPLSIAYRTPGAMTPVYAAGFPHNSLHQHVVTGIVGGGLDDNGLQLFNVPVTGGMSGAPIFDAQGVVVGQVTRTEYLPGWCPVAQGMPADVLRAYVVGSTDGDESARP